MESKKTPGTDAIPGKFYKVFWNDQPFFLASINASHAQGLLSISQRRGFLTLIPKKDKSLWYIKNWKPISLLNCDYKIAAKSVAKKSEKFRFIGECILLLNSILRYTNIEKFQDFSFSSILKRHLKLLLKKLWYIITLEILKGWSSHFFSLSRGVRQACPLSPYLFILCAEILGAAVRRDTSIHSIQISDKNAK